MISILIKRICCSNAVTADSMQSKAIRYHVILIFSLFRGNRHTDFLGMN